MLLLFVVAAAAVVQDQVPSAHSDAWWRLVVKQVTLLTGFFCPSVSIDAYRSIRMKEMERPGVKQVIVRKEKVGQRAEEPKGASVFSIRQKMKV